MACSGAGGWWLWGESDCSSRLLYGRLRQKRRIKVKLPASLLFQDTALLPSTTESIDIRGLRYNVRHWGPADAPPVFLLHGWMDASATFQFVVDALRQDWHLIAPDWRGYGKASGWGIRIGSPITTLIWRPCCSIIRQVCRHRSSGTAWAPDIGATVCRPAAAAGGAAGHAGFSRPEARPGHRCADPTG